MLGIRTPIAAADIYTVTAIAPGHPVFRLDGFGDDRGKVDAIVVKLEANQVRRQVNFSNQIMAIVDPRARTVVLKPPEVKALSTFASGGDVPGVDAFRAARELEANLKVPGVWVKMEVKRLTNLDDALLNRVDPNNPDKTDVRVIAKALKGSGGLEKLGEIIATDLFLGNGDRFGYPSGQGKHPDLPQSFRAIMNLGNVMVACGESGSNKPIGLDSHDPYSDFKDLNKAVNNQWGGVLLHSSKRNEKETYCGKVVEDLEMVLGPRNRKIPRGATTRLGTGRKKRLMKGMDSATKKLKKVLNRYRQSGQPVPVGLSSRMDTLGW